MNRLRPCTCLLILLFASADALLGLDPSKHIDQYGHGVWTSQHGLPGNAVYQILQTPDGYLWIRTSTGLVRFDGVRFVPMDTAEWALFYATNVAYRLEFVKELVSWHRPHAK